MKKVECIVVIVAFVCVACGGSSVTPVMAQAKKSVSIVLVKVVSNVFHVTVGENLAGTTQSARIALVTDTNSAVNAMEGAIMNASRVTVTVMKSVTTATERA